MDIIQLLPDHVANQIAAGEVIQRPSSAVKELLENAIDSGASSIKLLIKDAGRTLIQVIDNGCGMSETDARMCLERHATSKITSAEDLFSIKSMGFRGEALASMAAIGHLEIKTKLHQNELGTQLVIEGSRVKKQSDCSTNDGTSIALKNLFFNVPARRNFLKSDAVELKHIIEEFNRIALAHPDCEFSMFNNDTEVFKLKKSTLKQRIVALFGNKYNEKLVPVSEKTNLIDINGFVCKPEFAKKTKSEQYFFVNSRFIKSGYLHHAVNNAFKELIADGFQPSYFLFFEINPQQIDINIHPTKTEIKFEDEKAIYAIIRSCVKHALGLHNITPSLDFNRDPAFDNLPKNTAIPTPPSIKVDPSFNPFEKKQHSKSTAQNWQEVFENIPDISLEKTQISIDSSWEETTTKEEEIVFQLHKDYILSPIKSGLMIIHLKNAHERIAYEQLNNKTNEIGSQQLLFPKTIELSASDMIIIKEIQSDLTNFGFSFDVLNKNNIVLLSVPQNISLDDAEHVFEELLQHFKENKPMASNDLNPLALSVAKTISWRKIKKLDVNEMKSLINQLFACRIPDRTAQGKPTLVTLTNQELAQKF